MSSQNKPTVEDVKGKVEDFHWGNYRRDFQSDQSDLEKLYWYCVISDILNFHQTLVEEYEDGQEQINKLGTRLYRSYLGCFFEAHHLYNSLLDKFNRLTALYWNEQHDMWQTWKQQTLKIKRENFKLLSKPIKRHFENQKAISTNCQITPYDISAYDDWHGMLAQKVSIELINHLRHGTLAKRQPGTTNAVFPYHIEDHFIEVLDGYGMKYFKAYTTFSIINRIDQQFESGRNIINTKKQLDKDEPIRVAINDILGNNRDFQRLGHSQIAYLIRLKYEKSDGSELNLGSIKKALSRMDN